MNQQSMIDYMLFSTSAHAVGFDVIDPDINFSDDLPVMGSFNCSFFAPESPSQLRLNRADLKSFYNFTCHHLEPISSRLYSFLTSLDNNDCTDYKLCTDELYDDILALLTNAANLHVPRVRKDSFKFWWDQDIDSLNYASIESNRAWKAAAKPKNDPICDKHQSCRLLYRRQIREAQRLEFEYYSSNLHEAVLKKWRRILEMLALQS
jgi:hypothetical protein